MHRILLICLVCTLGTIEATVETAPGATSTEEPSAVFKRAFWKRPNPDDRILHSQLKEQNLNGKLQWQWFIVVDASTELIEDLIKENSFDLVPAKDALIPLNAPDWFNCNPDEMDILISRTGNLQILFDPESSLIYASDKGSGFRTGVPAPTKPIKPIQNKGRLPETPPPTP